jgi:hypothetical protein
MRMSHAQESRFSFTLSAFVVTAATGLLGLAPLAPRASQAQVIAEQTAGSSDGSNIGIYFGQSITTATGGPYTNITFNFFDNVFLGFTPIIRDANGNFVSGDQPIYADVPLARGSLFILDREYLGTIGNLNASTPGFVAQSQSATNDIYSFDPLKILQGGTQYFLYSNGDMREAADPRARSTPRYAGGNIYAGGQAYSYSPQFFGAGAQNTFEARPTVDLNFRLSGTPVNVTTPTTPGAVPEPSEWLAMGMAAASVGGLMLRARRKSTIANEDDTTVTAA